MATFQNYKGVLLSTGAAYTRQIWATGTDPLYGPDTPTQLMGSNAGNFLHGGAGDDLLYLIHTADRVSGGGGVDTAYATVDFSALPADVENLTMDARWSPVVGAGNDGANILKAVNAGVTLEGRGGDDVIISAGGDTFVFAPGSGADVVIGFHAGSDLIRLNGYSLDSFAKVSQSMTQVGADTLLRLSADDLILFKDTQVSSFSARDFQLSFSPASLTRTFSEEFDTLRLQQQGHADGWSAVYVWDRYDSHSAHTISGEAQIYVDPSFAGTGSSPLGLNPFSISNGVLNITPAATSAEAKAALWGHDYTSGVLTTSGSFSQTYGYFEMRAQLPAGQGAFPAFWLLSADNSYDGEIDVVETVNGSNQAWNHIHYRTSGSGGSGGVTTEGFSSQVPNLSGGFHTFGVLWTPQTLTWFVDGAAVSSTATPAAMNKPMYILADYAVGGSWAGTPGPAASLTPMQIDYIRAYSLDAAPGWTALAGPTSVAPAVPSAATSTAYGAPSSLVASAEGGPLDGGAGDEIIIGGTGRDFIRGMDGADTLDAGGGDDDVNGNKGADIVHGADGADWVRGGQGGDTIYGDAGSDVHVNGNRDDDMVFGGVGDDTVFGGQGSDTVSGDAGDDRVSGDLGDDLLSGGSGADRFVFDVGFGHDRILDFNSAEGDRILLGQGLGFTLSQQGGDTVLTLASGDQLQIVGVGLSLLGDWLAA